MSDLAAPLGLAASVGRRRPFPFALAGLGLLAFAGGVGALWVAFVDDPLGGEPVARLPLDVASITRGDIAVIGPEPATPTGAEPEFLPLPADRTLPVLGAGAPASTGLPTSADRPDLVADGPYGPLPRIAADGTRPLEAYAAPVPSYVGVGPKIVLIVGGLGLSASGTAEALRVLPERVTLAFAPYGSGLADWEREARAQGHELLLQLPEEPFDFPDNDPGPHTMLTSLAPSENVDRLEWLMARFGSYVGVVNYMGARFSSDTEAFAPVMQEIAHRGLLYVDDGSSPRSLAASVADTTGTPFVQSQLVVDATASASAIDAGLARLEEIARSRGLAVGTASALPLTISRIAEWSRRLEDRGITLVPASAALGRR